MKKWRLATILAVVGLLTVTAGLMVAKKSAADSVGHTVTNCRYTWKLSNTWNGTGAPATNWNQSGYTYATFQFILQGDVTGPQTTAENAPESINQSFLGCVGNTGTYAAGISAGGLIDTSNASFQQGGQKPIDVRLGEPNYGAVNNTGFVDNFTPMMTLMSNRLWKGAAVGIGSMFEAPGPVKGGPSTFGAFADDSGKAWIQTPLTAAAGRLIWCQGISGSASYCNSQGNMNTGETGSGFMFVSDNCRPNQTLPAGNNFQEQRSGVTVNLNACDGRSRNWYAGAGIYATGPSTYLPLIGTTGVAPNQVLNKFHLYMQARSTFPGNIAAITVLTFKYKKPPVPPPGTLKPYLAVYGGNISVGGGFAANGTCNNNGNINTFTNGNLGSGAQFAAFVMGTITQDPANKIGFSTSLLTTPPSQLTFSNTNPASLGGFTTTNCINPYRTALPFNKPKPPSSDISTLGVADETYYSPTSFTVTNGGLGDIVIPPGRSIKIFVNGDLIIKNNIKYNPNWQSLDDISNVKFVVVGNIYVANNVSTISGLYWSEPLADGSKGIIYTCTHTDGSQYTQAEVLNTSLTSSYYTDCNNQLTVYGQFVAQDIKWMRTYKDIGSAVAGESPYFGSSNAAEVIIDGPENYMATDKSGSNNQEYDYITSLPPIL